MDPLEHIKLYTSDSQSSNDVHRSKEQARVTTRETTPNQIVPETIKSCLKKNIEGGTSIVQSPSKNFAVNSTDDGIHEAVVPEPKSGSSLTKKTVSWDLELKPRYPHPINLVKYTEVATKLTTKVPNETSGSSTPRTMSRDRPVTRSMSPAKNVQLTVPNSPVTRSISSTNPMTLLKEGLSTDRSCSPVTNVYTRPEQVSPATARFGNEGKPVSSIARDSMSRKLDFGIIDRNDPRRRWQPAGAWQPNEAASFDLGFNDSPKEDEVPPKVDPIARLPVITSSNEGNFYGPAKEYEMLWDKFGEKLLQTDTYSSVPNSDCKKSVSQAVATKMNSTPLTNLQEMRAPPEANDLNDGDSKTTVPQAHQKRILKPAKAQLSPFVQHGSKKLAKSTVDVYNSVRKHGLKS